MHVRQLPSHLSQRVPCRYQPVLQEVQEAAVPPLQVRQDLSHGLQIPLVSRYIPAAQLVHFTELAVALTQVAQLLSGASWLHTAPQILPPALEYHPGSQTWQTILGFDVSEASLPAALVVGVETISTTQTEQ